MTQAVQKLFDEAMQRHRAGRLTEAEAIYRRILIMDARHADSLHGLGMLAFQAGNLNAAADLMSRAIAQKDKVAVFHYNLGRVLVAQGKDDDAAARYRRAIAINRNFAEAHANLGAICAAQKKADEAVACYNKALQIRPEFPEALSSLGAVLVTLGKRAEATELYRRAIALKPDFAEAHYNLGNVMVELGKLDDARQSYDRALAIAPQYAEAHVARAFLHLMQGQFAQAWPEYEWRWRQRRAVPHPFRAPQWDGGDLAGNAILLHCEQGLGDAIQFVRYAPLVKARGGKVLLVCAEPLVKLFESAKGIDRIIPDGGEIPVFDVQVPLLSLPGIFKTMPESIPSSASYLSADPQKAAAWKKRLAEYPGRKIGVVWRGGGKFGNDRNRSTTADQFAPFLSRDGITVVSLQKDATPDDIKKLGVKRSFLNAGPEFDDFADTAACMVNLDLVITVDTSCCHLASALGVPAWNLLAFAADWRWLRGRDDTPWYPSMRLFRQPELDDWAAVADGVRKALEAQLK